MGHYNVAVPSDVSHYRFYVSIQQHDGFWRDGSFLKKNILLKSLNSKYDFKQLKM